MMKRKLTFPLIILGLTVLAVLPAWAGGEVVSAAQARSMLEQENRPFLLDVRTPREYSAVHLADATLIPIDQVVQRLTEIPKNRPILIYCAVGSRSALVTDYLAHSGYGPIFNLDGGIRAWQREGYPVVSGTSQ